MDRKLLRAIVGVLIGGFFLWWSLTKLDLQSAANELREADYRWLLLGVVSLFGDYLIRSLRWHMMLVSSGSTISYRDCTRVFFACVALNNILPLRAGDISRAFGFRDLLVIPSSEVLGTMIVERLLDLLSLLVLFYLALAGAPRTTIQPGFFGAARILLLASVLALFLLLVLAGSVRDRMSGKGKWGAYLGRTFSAVASIAPAPVLIPLVLLSLAAWTLETGLFVCASQALHVPVPLWGPVLGMSIGTLSTLLPGAPGYVGTFDAATAQGLIAYGARQSSAVSTALLTHVALWLPLTAVGLAIIGARAREGLHLKEYSN